MNELCSKCGRPFEMTADSTAVGQPGSRVMCENHRSVPAVRFCRDCSAAICETCDFAFPGDIHLCPSCATRSLSSGDEQKNRIRWSIGLAAFSLLAGLVCASSSGITRDSLTWAIIVKYLVFVPTLIGFAAGISSFEKGVSNPWTAWLAVMWNGINITAQLVMIVAAVITK